MLGREAEAISIPYAHTPQRQPEILSREELARLFEAAGNLRSRTLLMTTYAAGLRVSEVCALCRRALLAYDWVVYAKPLPGGPAQVLDYLARYTHRVAISNERILGCDHEQVRIRARDNRSGGKRTVTLPTAEFISRFLRHVLPPGFKRIRHYGLLAANHKRSHLAGARAALTIPEPQPMAIEAAEAFFARVSGHDPCRCAHCARGYWHRVATLPPTPRCRDGPS